jgi:hypothetical protein
LKDSIAPQGHTAADHNRTAESMLRSLHVAIALAWLATGIYMLVSPLEFHSMTPGLSVMGPFNSHFIRDAAIAFPASGMLTIWGLRKGACDLAMAGALWPVLHAIFHIQVWAHRSYAIDTILAFDVVAVISPAFAAMAIAARGASFGKHST